MAVLGQGYVGLVVAMRASEAGFPVVGLEVDEVRARRLAAGDSFVEDVPDDVLQDALGRGYVATADVDQLSGFDVAVISVPTPLHDGSPDLSYIESAAGCGEAELAKIIENTFRHVNIALVNELAMFRHDLGIDVSQSIEAAATKPFGFLKFTPGPGVGGRCLPIDPSYPSWRVKQHLGESFRFIELAHDINEHMPQYVLRRVQAALNRDRKAVNGSRIVVLGLSYKPDVGDARESPSLPIIRQLASLGADVTAIEPHVDEKVPLDDGAELRREVDEDLLRQADLVLIVTDHAAFDYDLVVRASTRILDTRNRLAGVSADHVERL